MCEAINTVRHVSSVAPSRHTNGRGSKSMNLAGKTKRALSALVLGVVGSVMALQPAEATVIGNEAVKRGFYDNYSHFGLGFTDLEFQTDGTVTSWQAYASAGTIALLILRPTLTSSLFTLVGYDAETSTGGQQTFAADLKVKSGDILGAYLGTGDIAFAFDAPGVNVCSGPNCDVFFSPNGSVTDLDALLNQTITFAGKTDRTYSLNATLAENTTFNAQNVVTTPLPASLVLLLAGIGGLGFVARRRRIDEA